MYVKTRPGLISDSHKNVETAWKAVYPNLPFDYYYQDTVFDQYFNGFSQVAQVMGAASLIMIIISVSGIFGLALLIIGKKMKEISMRKVLGAGLGNIILLVNKEFIFAIGFAILLGMPISWILISNLFTFISPESSVSFIPVLLAFLGLLGFTALSVSWHIFKANTANPTQFLKID